MEDDLQRPYSVGTRDDFKEKMNKQISDISEIFCVSNSNATVLLMKLRWDSVHLSERLCQDDEKLLAESGLKPVLVTKDLSDSSCDEFYDFFDDVDDDDDDVKISTPFCSHKFSTTYWSKYLEKNFFSVEKTLEDTISCPHHDCGASVGRDTIENLPLKDENRYEEYVLRSYLEKNKIKQCPAEGCSYFIEFHRQGSDSDQEYGLNVVCLCGHTFCWRCRAESHRPVTCNNASDWLFKDLKKLSDASEKSLSGFWIEANTKPCPHCLTPIEIGLAWLSSKFVPCAYCSGRFCWKCMQTEESHETESGGCPGPVTDQDAFWYGAEVVDTSCLDRWVACEGSMLEAKSELKSFEESNNMRVHDVEVMRQGLMLIVQCRQFLKWSCVYERLYLENEPSKKEFLRFLQDYANTLVQSYAETLKKKEREKALLLSLDEVTCSRSNLSAVTSSIGNYFYNFTKALKDGLEVVEVKHYDDSSPCWLCDRCSYANTWLHKVCQVCCVSPVEKTSDWFLN